MEEISRNIPLNFNMTERRSWDFTPKPAYLNRANHINDFIPRVPFKFRKADFVENKYKIENRKFKNFHPDKYDILTGDYRKERPPAYSFGPNKEIGKYLNGIIDTFETVNEYDNKPMIIKNYSPYENYKNNSYNRTNNFNNTPRMNKSYFSLGKKQFGGFSPDRFRGGLTDIKNQTPGPGAYNIFDITMFSGTGRMPSSTFNNNLPKTMSQKYDRSVDVRRLNPGPGYYNHITNFGRIYF